ncbi:MAG: amylo-alpha-1,6-glucosidase [Actinomycetota bacterium]
MELNFDGVPPDIVADSDLICSLPTAFRRGDVRERSKGVAVAESLPGHSLPVHQVPFSVAGAWMSLSRVPAAHHHGESAPSGQGFRWRSHRCGGWTLGEVHVDAADQTRIEPGLLTWECPDGTSAQVTFDGTTALRFEASTTIRVILHGEVELAHDDVGHIVLTTLHGRQRYLVRTAGARVDVDVEGSAARPFARALTISPAVEASLAAESAPGRGGSAGSSTPIDGKGMTLVLSEAPSRRLAASDIELKSGGVAAAAATWARVFDEFRAPLLEGVTLPAGLGELAAYVLWSSIVDPAGGLRRRTVLMSKNWMDRAWGWDTCFNAVGLYGHDELALDQALTMLDHPDADGMLPDCVDDRGPLHVFTKPPMQGWALRRLLDRGVNPSDQVLTHALDALTRWTQWWRDGVGTRGYEHGFDSGWDNSTAFDHGSPMLSPDIATYLTIQLDTQALIADRLGRAHQATQFRADADRLARWVIDELWRGDGFVVRTPAGEQESTSLLTLVPLALGDRLPEGIRVAMVARLRRFIGRYGLATEELVSPHYHADDYWRGPMWAPPTVLIIEALAARESTLARDLVKRYTAACQVGGMAENHDPNHGAGYRDPAYTWTAAGLLAVHRAILRG